MANQKHLSLTQRVQIQESLKEHKSFKEIGRELDKDNTTISKEIKNHRQFKQTGALGNKFNDCAHRFGCPVTRVCGDCCERSPNFNCSRCGLCNRKCSDYKKEYCEKLNHPPYVCNGCSQKSRCTLEKAFYDAAAAQKEYEECLTESRNGRNITEPELQQIDDLISPLIKNGQSIHHVFISHKDEVNYCEKTIYNLVNDGFLSARNLDMPVKVRLRPRKRKKEEYKVDKKCRLGRTYEDFLSFRDEHPDMMVTELDSVEGVKGGPVLLTIYFSDAKLQLSFKRERNTSRSVTDILNDLYQKLGREDYCKLFGLLLADNGSEFSDPASAEYDQDGFLRSHLFYCDPLAPGQKGSCENNHRFIRRIIPKGRDLALYSDEQIHIMMNHINSYCRAELSNKSPYDMFEFLYGEEILHKLNLTRIHADQIILRPELMAISAPSYQTGSPSCQN